MERRERNRYDRNDYGPDYNSYDRDDTHYHSARNLTNEFEQEYQSHHPDMDRERYRYMRDRDRGGMRQSYHEGDSGGAYEQRRREEDRDFRGRDYGYQQRDRDFTDSYSSPNRYSQRSDDFGDRDRDRYSDRSRYGSQDRMREGYGVSDYGRMRQSSVRSNRGIPNAGITSSFSDDYGTTDFDRDRSYGISSGNYGAYGSQRGSFSRNRDDW